MRDTADRWKNVSTELRCVHSMLEELILYWTRWETLSSELEQWMRVAYTKLNLPEDEKLEFFQVTAMLDSCGLWRNMSVPCPLSDGRECDTIFLIQVLGQHENTRK
jgi:hypothetical protein